jgi:hypothetical protein
MATQNAETTGTISFRYNDKFQLSEVDFHHTVLLLQSPVQHSNFNNYDAFHPRQINKLLGGVPKGEGCHIDLDQRRRSFCKLLV